MYAERANEASDRILKAMHESPEISRLSTAWDLLKVKGLQLNDLDLSAAQAGWAFRQAKARYERGERPSETDSE